MIEIRRIDKGLDYSKYDKIFMIVRSMKIKSPHIHQLPELSPSPHLFKIHRNLVDSGNWNIKTFQDIYVPKFISDLKHSPLAIKKLNELYNLDRLGKNICLLCYCTNESLCHRSIIAGILQGMGCNVMLRSGIDYSHYYNHFVFKL